ncbi:diaminopimelate decarboxylase [Streptomyces sp. TverLS-915]|nr:diaminopimelate decarboxylase [Streptomyces sp. TverLS-915]
MVLAGHRVRKVRAPALPSPLLLTPRLEPRLGALLRAPEVLYPLVEGLGSPLNVVLPQQAVENVRRFEAARDRHHLRGTVYFAHKANRSSALVRALATSGAGLDVASLEELRHGLGSGFTPDRIGATGPKEPEFLWLAARTGVTVTVEDQGELERLAALVARYELPRVKVQLRLSGFPSQGVRQLSRPSRFGTPFAGLPALLDAVERVRERVEVVGVAYHIDTTGLPEKALALDGCLRALDLCLERGLRPATVDIGGGFGVSHLADAREWEAYTTELTLAALGRRPPLTWRGHGYGLANEGGTLRGSLDLYPGHRPLAGAEYLDALLRQDSPAFGRPLGELLLDGLYDLAVEPGRALMDQCGATLARVVDVRTGPDGIAQVRLAMNADDCALEEHGILVDPLLLPRPGGAPVPDPGPGAATGVYLHGNLCLESDLITRRLVQLPRLPAPGELLAFANTAGYAMDFSAQNAERRPPARKVALERTPGGGWRWTLDEQWWPTATEPDTGAPLPSTTPTSTPAAHPGGTPGTTAGARGVPPLPGTTKGRV